MTNVEPVQQASSSNLRQHYEDFERQRQFHLLYFFNGIAALFLFTFGIAAFYNQRTLLAIVLTVLLVLAIFNILFLKLTGKQRFARTGFVIGVLILIVHQLISGGVNNNGPLWCYPSLAATFFILGTRRGVPLAALLFTIAIIAFYVPLPGIEVANYTNDFKLRFLATFGVLSIFVGLHEFARTRNQDELYRVSDKLDQLSKIDQLTGLPNRRYMIGRMEAENSRFARSGRPFSLLYGDIDNFKEVNDQCGHQTGDHVLQMIAQKTRATLRQHDEACRWGGEEFLFMLPETDQELAREVAEKLRASVAELEFKHNGISLRLTMSFGVHTVDRVGNIDEFIHQADKKLYMAKNAGKDRVVANLE